MQIEKVPKLSPIKTRLSYGQVLVTNQLTKVLCTQEGPREEINKVEILAEMKSKIEHFSLGNCLLLDLTHPNLTASLTPILNKDLVLKIRKNTFERFF